jgi:predicted lipoprotein with Yx(FWY)xxD motif
MIRLRVASCLAGCGVLVVTGLAACSWDQKATAPQSADGAAAMQLLPTTPRGITLVEVVREMQASQPEYLWTRLGDAKGNTLFVSEADRPGVSNCTGDCAQEFPPLKAPAEARSFGDWSLVTRTDGTLQWAYLGKPLYTFSKERRVNQVVDNIVLKESKNAHLTSMQYDSRADVKDPLMPPKGWSVARFDPAASLTKPDDIGVARLTVQDGVGPALVDLKGMTLYGYDGNAEATAAAECIGGTAPDSCTYKFVPALAPDAANARVGDFSVIVHKSDHVRQWAYRGVPLYRFVGDNKPGDTLGVYGDTGRWQVMFLSIDPFPENVQAITAVGRGTVLADTSSMPMYMVARYDDRWSGFNAYQGYSNAYRMGKMLGTRACNSECLRTRQPVLASSTDESRGYWEVFDREDGARQWAYKGFALYTYSPDKPGIVTGNNVIDLVLGDSHGNIGLLADEFGPNGPSSIVSSDERAKGYSTASLQVVKDYPISLLKEGEVAADQDKVAAFYWYAARP